MGRKIKRGKKGNAAQYLTRNQAIRKLQLRLSEFRRLCILKGIHPREPKKKVKGANKTYYHAKDINFLAHEPLLNTFRGLKAYDRKVVKAKAKMNMDLAKRLMNRKPTYKLDHLVKERYPSFADALRDLDDPLTMVHLFATLPAEKRYDIPTRAVETARRLALEWQAYIVRTNSLRKVFVSIKGYYYQADVMGQVVTWLVPHQLAQVLPTDVDYRIMLTFLEFYETLLQFVLFKLYHSLGLKYPPVLDPKLEEAAAGLAAVMKDLAGLRDTVEQDLDEARKKIEAAEAAAGERPAPEVQARLGSLQAKLKELTEEEKANAQEEGEEEEEEEEEGSAGEEDDEGLDIDSGDEDEDEDEEDEDEEGEEGESEEQSEEGEEEEGNEMDAEQRQAGHASTSQAADPDGTRVAGGALGVDLNDASAVCGALFKGLVFFLAREVPREPLLMVIRAFGGTAAWQGEGSPFDENSESITHQVVDRPTQGHRFLSREYVQPQWVFDSANFRVLMPADLYVPGKAPPPHLSPFVNDEEEGYTPEFANVVKRLQDAATRARQQASGVISQDGFVGEDDQAAGDAAGASTAPGEDLEAVEKAYVADLAKELKAAGVEAPELHEADDDDEEEEEEGSEGGEDEEDDDESEESEEEEEEEQAAAAKSSKGSSKKRGAPDADEEAAMKDIMMTRKNRKLYQQLQKHEDAKKQRVEALEAKAKALKKQQGQQQGQKGQKGQGRKKQ